MSAFFYHAEILMSGMANMHEIQSAFCLAMRMNNGLIFSLSDEADSFLNVTLRWYPGRYFRCDGRYDRALPEHGIQGDGTSGG